MLNDSLLKSDQIKESTTNENTNKISTSPINDLLAFSNLSINDSSNRSINRIENIELKKRNGNDLIKNSPEFEDEQEICLQYFDNWQPIEQTDFVENLIQKMCYFQKARINNFINPMLKRDFISLLPVSIAENILSRLDADSLHSAEYVSPDWLRVIAEGLIWKKLIESKVKVDSIWHGISLHRGWSKFLFKNNVNFNKITNIYEQHKFYKELYFKITNDIKVNNNLFSSMTINFVLCILFFVLVYIHKKKFRNLNLKFKYFMH